MILKYSDKIIEFYYSLRQPKIIYTSNKDSFSIQFKLLKHDSRSFEWYKDRCKYGFDERQLWNLSGTIWEKFIKLYPECDDSVLQEALQNWHNGFNDIKDKNIILYKLRRNIVVAYNIIKTNPSKLKELAKWIYPRVLLYNKWECPISIGYKNKEFTNIASFRSLLEEHLIQYSNSETIDETSFKLSLFILLKYGW